MHVSRLLFTALTAALLPGCAREIARTTAPNANPQARPFVEAPALGERPLLIVDDGRLDPDRFISGQLDRPRGQWPSAAELDTFFFAVGGFLWQGYPPLTGEDERPGWPRTKSGHPLTKPGLFNGYDYDTLGTRGTSEVPLAVLSKYRHVVWYTDATAATYTGDPLAPVAPITALRRMTSPGQVNTLAQYVASGGRLWLMGGGAAFASLISWNAPGTTTDEYSAADGELVPGRFMYDWSRWRSRIRTPMSTTRLALHVDGAETPFQDPSTAPGRGWAGQPNYARLPASLDTRTTASDPLPPRVQGFNFYFGQYQAEVLPEPNVILEDGASVLDTLYFARFTSSQQWPSMTFHHGADGIPAVFTGFGIWNVRRSQAEQVVDWVLQDVWRLRRKHPATRDPIDTGKLVRRDDSR